MDKCKDKQRDLPCVSRKTRKLVKLGKLFHVSLAYIQGKSLNLLENNKMKLSTNKTELTGLKAGTHAAIQNVFIFKFAFGPESYRETVPWIVQRYVLHKAYLRYRRGDCECFRLQNQLTLLYVHLTSLCASVL